MKTTVCLFFAVCILCYSLCGCGTQSGRSAGGDSSPAASNQNEFSQQTEGSAPASVESDVVDLTVLSSTMVYAEVYNMMFTPEDYIDKTVKMRGQFAVGQYVDENGQLDPEPVYYACVIADATACCQQGLEFVLDGDFTYPDDYPELGSQITVTGVFQTYEDNGYTCCHLVDAKFID